MMVANPTYTLLGPTSVSVAASDWGLYYSGVFDGCPYDQNIAVNHAVQLVRWSHFHAAGRLWHGS